MKITRIPLLLIICSAALVSCQKGNTITATEQDTSYLRKTRIKYYYDDANTPPTDTANIKWLYDDKHRQTLQLTTSNHGQTVDSIITAYSADQVILDERTYWKGNLYAYIHGVQFFNSRGFRDSNVVTSVNNTSYYDNYKHLTVYYNDADGNDTLDRIYDMSPSPYGSLRTVVYKTYMDKSLTRTVWYLDGNKEGVNTWVGGNAVNDSIGDWATGNLVIHEYGYSNVPSGGYNGYIGSKNLLIFNKQRAPKDPSLDLDFSVTYTFDKAGRVSSAKGGKAGETGYYIEVNTYY